MPNAIDAAVRSGVSTAREKYAGTASSSPRMRAWSATASRGAEQVGEAKRRAQVGLAAAVAGEYLKRSASRDW